MAPTIHAAKITLSCPLFSADFDPRNNGRLIVGGGGGEGRSGVGNKISLLDTSRRNQITEAFELNLSREEDSVTSLAAAPQIGNDENSLVVLAGINSSLAQQKQNNNQHMRAFQFEAPRKTEALVTTDAPKSEVGEGQEDKQKEEEKAIPGKATELSRASIFRSKNGADSSDTYQRVLRLSPWKRSHDASDKDSQKTRVGAIATGMAPSGEIVFFRATESPTESDVIGRIRLGSNEEAEDVDFASLGHGRFRVAYTNGVDVMVGEISSSTRSNAAPDVKCVYTIPLPSSGARAARPKFRALRFLSSTTLLILQNAPNRSGSELVLLSLPTAKQTKAQILRRRKLPRSVKIGLGFDICSLGTNPQGQEQIIIAASGSDHSITMWTLEYGPKRGYSNLRLYTTLHDVHPFSMTKLCFSPFIAPAHPVTPEVLPQNVKLASVSMGNTVVVHTLPLSPFPASSRTPRYVLSLPGPAEFWEILLFTGSLLLSLSAIIFVMLAFLEIRGGTPPFFGAKEWLPGSIRNSIAREYIPPPPGQSSYLDSLLSPSYWSRGDTPVAETYLSGETESQIESLKRILDRVHSAGAAPVDIETPSPQSLSVIVRCNQHEQTAEQSVIVETYSASHHAAEEVAEAEKLRAWHDLSGPDQAVWKQRLTDAGRWAASEGETVLQGVLFSEACGQLGQFVRQELL
ncbi:uncharacterized protein N7459_003852 [Penicillium hispanicum]|uniref:uncharacterized protein n=1 Tax=Penicillium hispanicum TaxID=1080232 RepID=UPI00253FB492|nr:uncharacterized protein N7459_003852 [Penicillium hispanicum]KAJ5584052.1 hypothetical protein N7459_003852 [Penicillium hispanicum]